MLLVEASTALSVPSCMWRCREPPRPSMFVYILAMLWGSRVQASRPKKAKLEEILNEGLEERAKVLEDMRRRNMIGG